MGWKSIVGSVRVAGGGAGAPGRGRVTQAARRPVLLWAHWDEILRKMREARSVAFFLDYDGTISPRAPRPEQAVMAVGASPSLERLALQPGAWTAIISGRRRGDIERRIHVRGIRYLGLYGWETEEKLRIPRAAADALRRAHELVTLSLAREPGLWIEDKGVSFTVHFGDASAAKCRRALEIVRRTIRNLQPRPSLSRNSINVEVLPAGWGNKGGAVKRELRRPEMRKALPVYFGDDLSDEPAFQAARSGITVRVGDARRTLARYWVRDTAEAAKALQLMEVLLP
jgi:trehalose 6-phosphate phosphatase